MRPNLWVSWSSGKDSAFALYELLRENKYNVTGLLTTVNETFGRVAMHSTREELLIEQAKELSIPLIQIKIPCVCSNEIYEQQMRLAITDAQNQGVTHMMFGDLFLEDIRKYRKNMLCLTGITPVFPLWQRPTKQLALEMIESGFKAIIVCVDPKQLSPSFAGREFNKDFLRDLPMGVDPCGENGEFHTFVYDGPIFKKFMDVVVGEVVERDGFMFADVLLRKSPRLASRSPTSFFKGGEESTPRI